MAKSKAVWLGVLITLVLISGCQRSELGKFKQLSESEFGIGVSLGMSSAEVHEELGFPSSTTERQGGASVDDYYLLEGINDLTGDEPYINLTFHYDRLIRIGCKFFPLNDTGDLPPFIMEPLPGIKLGARRSAFVDTFGQLQKGSSGESWRFNGVDGGLITVKAMFSEIVSTGDNQCSTLSVTYSTRVENPRGEAFKDKK